MKKFKEILAIMLIKVESFLISFFSTALIVKLFCYCTSFQFTWKIAGAVWCVMLLLSSVFGGNKRQ